MRAAYLRLIIGSLAILVVAGTASELSAQKAKKKPAPTGPINPNGRPKMFAAGQPARLAIWHGEDVWHIRATAKKGAKAVFQGRVEVAEGTVIYQGQALEKGKAPEDSDWVLPLPKNKGFVFQLVTKGDVDGFEFKASPEAKEIQFTLLTKGDDDASRIFIGAAGRHPEKASFTLPAHP
jgi:hypothetical protein